MKAFSVRDLSAEGYNRPFFSLTPATAMRELASGLKQDSNMANFASDFSLFEIGEFDTKTGELIPLEKITKLCEIAELLKDGIDGQPEK